MCEAYDKAYGRKRESELKKRQKHSYVYTFMHKEKEQRTKKWMNRNIESSTEKNARQ